MSATNRLVVAVSWGLLSALTTMPAQGQLANASAATLGVGGNATAVASGFGAISVNPAGLGMPGPGFSLAVAPVSVRQGLGPVKLSDLSDFEGKLIPAATKEDWLARVVAQGRQTGSLGAEVSEFAVTNGRWGLQLSTLAGASMDLSPGVVEAVLYGNAGRTSEPVDLSLSGSSLRAFGVTTAGFAMGFPLPSAEGDMAVGVTVKYSVGHVVAVGRDQGGGLESDPVRVEVEFPLITFDDDGETFNNGSGIGLDVGFQMRRDRLSFGAAVLNVFNTFGWSADHLVYRAGAALLEEGGNQTDFGRQSVDAAPAEVREILDDMRFDPIISVGAAYDVGPDLTISTDIRNRFGDGMGVGPKLHAGMGAEYRGLGVLHLRGGAALITDGVQLGGGASVVLGPVNLSVAGARQMGDQEDTNVAQFTLSFGGR